MIGGYNFGFNGGSSGGGGNIDARVTYLEDNEYKVAYYQEISSATGTITIPAEATLLPSELPSQNGALVETIVDGKPSEQNPTTITGAIVTVSSFDASGNYVLSGTPSAYPVALVFYLKIKAKYWQNLNTNFIIEGTEELLNTTFLDSQFTIKNAADQTRSFKFDAGQIPTSTANTYILPPVGGYLLVSSQFSGGATVSTAGVVTLTNSAVTGQLLTGYVSGAGTISGTDSILSAIQKLNGNIGALTTGVSSVFGRTGAVTAQLGDYTTNLVTEGSNLYFTNARAIASTLTGYVSGAGTITAADSVLTAIQKLNGNISGLVTGVSSVFGRTGAVVAQSGDYTTTLVTEGTNLYFTNARAISSTLTGYVSGAGTISATDTVLTAIQKLNGNIGALTYVSSFSGGSTGLTPAIATTGAVTLGGTLGTGYGGTGTSTTFTQGSIVFAGVGGVYSQENLDLNWDMSIHRMLLSNADSATFAAPQAGTILHIISNGANNGRVSLDTYAGTNTFGAIYQGRKARGTNLAPTAAIADDTLALIGGDGYGSTGFHGSSIGAFLVKAEATLTDASAPTYLSFFTTPTGSTTSVERWRINSVGNLSNTGATGTSYITLKAGSANTAPLQFTSGTLTNGGNRLAGSIQFNSGVFYGTTANATAEKPFSLQTGIFTTGSVIYVDGSGILTQDNANFFWDGTNHRLGIGTTTPIGSLEVSGTASPQEIYVTRYSADANAGAFIGRKARGTSASPTAVQSGDTLSIVGARGYGATAFSATNKANISFIASENWTDSAQGTYVSFNSTTAGGTTRTEVGKLDNMTFTVAGVTMQGNLSSTAWTTSGIGLKNVARTLTDTSSTGTVAAAYTNVLSGNTIAASSATTYTDYANLFLGIPTVGTNVTFTNVWSLRTAGGALIDGTLRLSNQTASTIAIFDASKNVISATTATYPSLTELAYVKGVTSALQTQLNGKLVDQIPFYCASTSPADATTYYAGTFVAFTIVTSSANRRFKFRNAGTLTSAGFTINQTNNGSNEAVTVYLRNETAGTDYTIGTFTSDFGANTTVTFNWTGLTGTINTTDYYTVKFACPTWVTNPTAWVFTGNLNVTA